MKLTIPVPDFKEAMATVQTTVDRRQESDAYLLFMDAAKDPDRLRLYSSNGIERTLLKVPCTVSEPGRVAIMPRELIKILPTLDPEEKLVFQMKADEKSMSVKIGKSKMRIVVSGKHDLFDGELKLFPYTAEPALTVNSHKLKEIIRRAEPFVYRKEDRPHMQSILLMTSDNHLVACSTNQVVIAKALINGLDLPNKGNGDSQVKISVPFRSLGAMEKILNRIRDEEKNGQDVKMILTHNDSHGRPNGLFIRTDDVFYGTSLSAYDFPDRSTTVEQLVTVNGQVQLNRDALLCALRRAQPFARDGKWVTIAVSDNVLSVSAAAQKVGEMDEAVPGVGEGYGAGKINLSIDHLITAIGATKEEVVTFQLTEQGSVVLLTSGTTELGKSTYAFCVVKA